jgi:anti-sigma regulatory factor (Ser/Thr protein kinase)
MPAEGAACREGREFVSAHLLSWGVPERIVDVAVLITSELVANAVTYGPPPVGLRVRLFARCVRIEIGDSSPQPPRMLRPGYTEIGGRGLLLVDRLAARWGYTPQEEGKVVWCEVALPG